ncbi:hypothetical protein [Microbacterium sp. SORGH_AS_0888]|uniref:hypothetical protein n=1 Tax=Microbacterium sp. SORGH_AS_0888 TaxID=3041791 RepID=UPI0027860548|nr:hypothetical protein [Microbacterium sp. SORGH_AS_0888]MDQ1128316.1 hypothetical protein [Microbacterium sp. SORGH_AS_0888]
MSASETTPAGPADTPKTIAAPRWVVAAVAGFFGLFYAYAVWTAVSFLLQQAGADGGLTGYGWFVLLLPIVFPIIVFVAAVLVGRRRRILPLSLVMFAGLTVVAVFWLNVFSLTFTASASIYVR